MKSKRRKAFAANRDRKISSLRERFDAKVCKSPHPNGCWIWTAVKHKAGYGKILHNRKTLLAHRVSFELNRHQIPDGLLVLHHCDNPSCVNPDHLFLGTYSDNAKDRDAKGRAAGKWGIKRGGFKLSPQNVLTIRKRRLSGEILRVIGLDFGISETLVCAIAKRRRWEALL